MAQTITRDTLSSSSDGKAIKVAATATPGTAIHTGPTSTSVYHEVWLYGYNSDTVAREVTIEFGGAAAPDENIKVTLPPKSGEVPIVLGLTLKGNATPKTVKAFCATTNVITIAGYVNVIQ